MKDKLLFQYTLPIPPVVKKNSKTGGRNPRTGKHFPGVNKKYQKYTPGAILLLRRQWAGKSPLDCQIHTKFTFYYSGPEPDLSNLYEAIQDWLQVKNGAGIIADDRAIHSHDGSRKHHVCKGCAYYAPKTKKRLNSTRRLQRCPGFKNCEGARPRIGIQIFAFEG